MPELFAYLAFDSGGIYGGGGNAGVSEYSSEGC